MNRVCKRMLSLLLSVLMIFSLMSVSAFAAGDGTPEETEAGEHTHTFLFYADGGKVDEVVLREGETLTQPDDPEKSGHRFVGWFGDEEGTIPFTLFGETAEMDDGTTDVYAVFERVFSIRYLDAGNEVIRTDEAAEGAEYAFRANDPAFTVDSGKINTGWKDQNDVEHKTGLNETISVTEDLTLTPILQDGWVIRFDTQGGSTVPSQYVLSGNTAERPAEDPTRDDYEFDNWYTSADGEELFDFSAAPAEDAVIYAHWTEQTGSQGGSETDQTFMLGAAPGEQNAPEGNRAHTHTWVNGVCSECRTNVVSEDTIWDDTASLTTDLVVESGVTLTVRKTIVLNGVTVSGGGTIVASSDFQDVSTSATNIHGNVILSHGNSTLNGVTVNGNRKARVIRVDDGTLTLTSATVTGGSAGESQDGGGILILSGSAVVLSGAKVNDNETVKRGSSNDPTGGGIAVNSGATLTMYSGSQINNNKAGNGPGGVLVRGGTFVMYGGEIKGNEGLRSGSGGGVRMISGGRFTMENGVITGNTAHDGGGGVAVFANSYFTMNNGEITNNHAALAGEGGGGVEVYGAGTFVMNNGKITGNTAVGNGGAVYCGVGTATINGGTFMDNFAQISGGGFYCTNNGSIAINGGMITENSATVDGGGVANGSTMTIASSVILYNNSADSTSDDLFNADGATITFTEPVSGLMLGSREITGWFDDGTTRWDGDTASPQHVVRYTPASGSVTDELRLKAAYGIAYKVIYDLNGADSGTAPATEEHEEGQNVTVAGSNGFDKSGYTFTGWNTEAGGGGTPYAAGGSFSMPNHDVTLYAQWEANTDTPYTVEYYYEVDGAYPSSPDEKDESRSGTTDTEVSVTEADKTPTREKYALDSTQTSYFTGRIAGDGSLTLKVFFRRQYTITYDPNGGKINGQTDNVTEQHYYGDQITIIAAPTREGYRFLYWKGSEYNPGDSYTVKGDHTFTAQWETGNPPRPPQTGDDTRILLHALTMGVSGTALLLTGLAGYRKKKLRGDRG